MALTGRRLLPSPPQPVPYVIPKVRAPLRVIDLQLTLDSNGGICFCNPNTWPAERRWNYHVLSHAWSRKLKDFDFSKKIGKRVGGTGLGKSAYENAFKQAHLQDEASYQDFMRLLQLLKGDGVEYLWFDMLCINQAEKGEPRIEGEEEEEEEEKAAEIANMACYYRYNLGCYVVMHGVGMGYNLWREPPASLGTFDRLAFWKGSRRSVPRWFSCVWTLREYVLPSRIIFIVQGLSPSTISHLNHFIKTYSNCTPIPMMCSCVASNRRYIDVHQYKTECIATAHKLGIKNLHGEIINPHQSSSELLGSGIVRASACSGCGTKEPLIRRVPNEANIYFVDGKAIFLLVDLDSGEPAFHQREFLNSLMHLQSLATSDLGAAVGLIVQEVGKRQCEKLEDRVLAILGLLQVGGEHQVRIGQDALEHQLLQLGPNLSDFVFVQLCLANKESGFYDSDGLSWAPNLTSSPPKLTLIDIPPFPFQNRFAGHEINVMKAMEGGRFKLQGMIVKARIVPTPRRHILSHKHDPIICYFCRNYQGFPYSSLALHQIRHFDLLVGSKLSLPLDVHLIYVHGKNLSPRTCRKIDASSNLFHAYVEPRYGWFHSMRVNEDENDFPETGGFECGFSLNLPENICAHMLPSFDVWLLHMGRMGTGLMTRPSLLICMGTVGTGKDQELHKLGTLSLADRYWDASYSDVHHLTECILGGFGKHKIQKLWEALVKPPSTCYHCLLKQSGEKCLKHDKARTKNDGIHRI